MNCRQQQHGEPVRATHGQRAECLLLTIAASVYYSAEQTQMNQLQISELEESRAFREERRRQFAAERERQEDEIRQAKLNFLRGEFCRNSGASGA